MGAAADRERVRTEYELLSRLRVLDEDVCYRLLNVVDEARELDRDGSPWPVWLRKLIDGRYRHLLRRVRELTAAEVPNAPSLVASLTAVDDAMLTQVEMVLSRNWALKRRSSAERPEEENLRPSGEPQERFGNYEIFRPIGQGGMGTVHEAWQEPPGRRVALKRIKIKKEDGQPEKEAERAKRWAEALRRFEQEAAHAGSLDHPGIVPVHDVGSVAGTPYYSMPCVDGDNLRKHLKLPTVSPGDGQSTEGGEAGPPQRPLQKQLPPRHAAELVQSIAKTMQYAHRRGVIHCDLKPENILIDRHGPPVASLGAPRITDFGVARSLRRNARGDTRGGSPAYLAPEQYDKFAEADRRTDVYAMGVILCELLTGQLPFQAEKIAQLLTQKQLGPEQSSFTSEPAVPPDLKAIACKCLQPVPRRRYATAQELANDLENFLAGKPVTARRVRLPERLDKWRRREPWVAATLATVSVALIVITLGSLVAAGVYRFQRDRADAFSIQAEERLSRQYVSNAEEEFSAGNDFRALPWTVEALRFTHDPRQEQMHRRRIGIALRQAATPLGDYWHPSADHVAWSADGKRLVVSSGNAVRVIDPATGQPQGPEIKPAHPVEFAAISPDGKQVVTFGRPDQFQALDEVRRQMELEIKQANGDITAMMAEPAAPPPLALVWDAASGKQVQGLTARDAWIDTPGIPWRAEFSADGRYLLVLTGAQQLAVWNLQQGQEVALEGAVFQPMPGDVIDPSIPGEGGLHTFVAAQFSKDSQQVSAIDLNGAVRTWDLESSDEVAHVASAQMDDFATHGAISPDGIKAAVFFRQGTIEVYDLQQARAILSHKLGVTDDLAGYRCVELEFNPQGDRLLMAWEWSFADNAQSLKPQIECGIWDFRLPPEAAGAAVGLPLTEPLTAAAFDPTGRKVLVASGNVVNLCDAQTGFLVGAPLDHAERVAAAAWSRDGSRVATVVDFSPDITLAPLVPRETGDATFDAMVQTSQDLFQQQDNRLYEAQVRVWQIDGTSPHVAELDARGAVEQAIASPDGRLALTAYLPEANLVGAGGDALTAEQLSRHLCVVLWDLERHAPIALPDWPAGLRPLSGDWSANGQYLHVQFMEGDSLAAVERDENDSNLAISPHAPGLVELTPEDVAIWSQAALHRVWDVKKRQIVHGPWERVNRVAASAFRTDSRAFLLMDREHLQAWSLPQGNELFKAASVFEQFRDAMSHAPEAIVAQIAAWTPDLLVFGNPPDLRRLAADGKTETLVLLPKGMPFMYETYSEDGRLLAAVQADARVRLWELATGNLLHERIQLSTNRATITFSGNGAALATITNDGEARVWDVATGAPRTPPILVPGAMAIDSGAVDPMYQVLFSQDGNLLLTMADSSAALWDATTGERLSADLYASGQVQAVSFTENQLRFFCVRGSMEPIGAEAAPDGPIDPLAATAYVGAFETVTYDLTPAGESPEVLERRVRALTHRRVDDTAGLVPLDVEERKALSAR